MGTSGLPSTTILSAFGKKMDWPDPKIFIVIAESNIQFAKEEQVKLVKKERKKDMNL